MKLKALLSALLVAGIATSLAVASPPPGKGREAGAGSTTTSADRELKRGRSAEARARRPVVMLVLKGEFVSGSEGSFAMLVKHSNKHARLLRGKQVTVKVDGKTKIRRQGKGKAQLSDLLAGDRLHVLVRARKSADASSLELLARHVFARPARDAHDDDEGETGTTTTTSTTTTDTAPTAD
jgi:hypothetical protein